MLALSLVLLSASALPIEAATVSTNIVTLGSGNYNIYVYPGKAAYTSLVNVASGVFGDGKVLDYRFLNCVGSAVNFAGYAVGTGDRVLAPTNASSFTYSNYSYAKVWTTTDPGTGAANYTANTEMQGTSIKGEVDIAGMSTVLLYFIGGKIPNYSDATHSVSLVMSGAGKTNVSVNASQTVSPGNAYIWEFSFGDAAGYQKISYNCNLESYSRGRFMGLVLDGVLVPKGTVLVLR